MKYISRLEVVLRILLVMSIVLTGAGAYIAFNNLTNLRQLEQIDRARDLIVRQLQAFSVLERSMGYTHFIHNFKNAVLRQDTGRMRLAQEDLDLALTQIGVLADLNPSLLSPLEDLRSTLAEYRRKSGLGIRLIEQGLGPQEIDRFVKVDDTAAYHALVVIYDEISGLRVELDARFHTTIDDLQHISYGGFALAAGLIVAAFVLMWIYVAATRQTSALLRVRETLRVILGVSDANNDHERLESGIIRLSNDVETQQQELHDLTRDLSDKNEELRRFASAASHDMQEPLRRILANIDLIQLKGEKLSDEDLKKHLMRIDRSAKDMRRLISDLLQFSKMEALEIEFAETNLRSLVDGILEDYAEEIAAAQGQILNRIGGDFVLDCDGKQLTSALRNLIENAIKYAKKDSPPVIEIDTEMLDGSVAVCVRDNGIGFDAEFAENIFQPFVRLHGRMEYPGSGLGLSIVKKVAERHGGTVSAAPRPEGGSQFKLIIPTQQEGAAADVERAA